MARKKQQRIPTDGGGRLTQNPFGALDGLEVLPGGPEGSMVESSVGPEKTSKRGKKNKNRGRVDIIRQTAPVSYTHLRAHETKANLVCRLLLEKKKNTL